MLQKKICMLGSFAVGKTSLVRRYVDSIFSENYVTTIGVKIDKKVLSVNNTDLGLILWDVYGEDNHQSVLPSYLRGMAAYILVIDPSRPATFVSAKKLHTLVLDTLGEKPFVLVLNKSDIKSEWKMDEDIFSELSGAAIATIETSAKTDTGVDEVFQTLGICFTKAA